MRTPCHTAGILLLFAVVASGRLAQGQPISAPALATRAEAMPYVQEQWTVVDGLPVNNLNDVVQTRDGYLWIATWDGLVRFDGVRFTTFNVGNTQGLRSNRIFDLYVGRDGALWGFQVEPKSLFRLKDGRFTSSGVFSGYWNRARVVGEDEEGRLWLRAPPPSTDTFVYADGRIEPVEAERIPGSMAALPSPPFPWRIEDEHHVYHDDQHLYITPSPVLGYEEDHEGSFWIVTGQHGLHRFRPAALTTLVVSDAGFPGNFSAVAEDSTGMLWAKHLVDNTAYRVQNGILFRHLDSSYLSWLDPTDVLAVPHACKAGLSSFHAVIHQDRQGRRWYSAHEGGVCLLQGGRWTHYDTEAGFPSERVSTIHEGQDGTLWFLTVGGGFVRYRGGRFEQLTTTDGLSDNHVRGFHEDEDGILWVGTYGRGLNRVDLRGASDLSEARITVYGVRHGLYDDVIHAIVEDDDARLWMSTNRGLFWVRRAELNALAQGEIDRVRSVFYDERDGMRNREANGGGHLPGLKARDGRLYFPTQDGVVMVDPRRIAAHTVPPPIVIEGVVAGDTTFLPHDGPARLSATQRDFEVAYTGLSFLAPEQMRFRYRLEGYDRTWREVSQRRAFYTGVPPGSYTFRVRAMNKDGLWSEDDAVMTLTVAPYFYETAWFYALCGLALLLLGWAGYRARTRQLRQRQQALEALVDKRTRELRAEKAKTEAQAEQLRALDAAKSRFFANITHEFRTPLTLILGPLKSALTGSYGPTAEPLQEAHRMMLRNGQRLLRLINQILDLAKAEAGQLTLEAEVQDLSTLLTHAVRAFAPLAERQGLRLGCTVPETPVAAALDAEQFEKVFLNLLSNAFKFTEPGGAVEVVLRRVVREAEIAVRDTGCGIAPEQLPLLFERFFQADDSATRTHEGTGIGLALAKEIVELHGGSITVESTPGAGSTFTVRLPLAPEAAVRVGAVGNDRAGPNEQVSPRRSLGEDVHDDHSFDPSGDGRPVVPDEEEGEDRTTVLIVDDNADVRAFVRSILEPAYRVREAPDGADGLAVAKAALPDLIISDVMMPKMDGFALSRALKEDASTDCIPVILLTARADADGEVAGLGTGADDYVTKPFEAEVLRARVAGLIASRQHLRARFSGERPVLEAATPARSPFEQRLREIVETHLGEPEFNPEVLADEAALSYKQLYRRLREEQDETPSQFIRRVRVERAAQLLAERAGTVSEVAYAVGFNSLSYFNRSFREHFDCAPSAYA